MKKNFSFLVALACLLFIFLPISESFSQEKVPGTAVEKAPSLARRAGWAIFGEKYYSPNLKYPVAEKPFFYNKILAYSLPLKQTSSINKGADETGWVPIPINKGRVYYRAEYHLKDLAVPLNDLINDVLKRYKTRGDGKSYSEVERQKILEKGKVQIVMFSKKDFFLRYHPGKNLLTKENGDKDGKILPQPRSGLEIKPIYIGIPSEDISNLVGVFNGTFHNNNSKWRVKDKLVRPGLIVEGKVIDEPLKYFASITFFGDQNFSIDEYADIPTEKFITLRQNNFLVLDNGQLSENGAYPWGWKDADNEVLRSYLFTTKDNQFFGYVWTNFCPPAIIGQVMQSIGAGQMMLLDINPVINAIFSSPNTTGVDVPFNRKTSYFFVPNEENTVNAILLAIAKEINGPIQQNQYEALIGSIEHDFFSVYLR